VCDIPAFSNTLELQFLANGSQKFRCAKKSVSLSLCTVLNALETNLRVKIHTQSREEDPPERRSR